MTEVTLLINLVTDSKIVHVPYTSTITTAEDVCITLCKQLCIGPAARHLFALRVVGSGRQTFLMPASTFGEKNPSYDLRVRFKVASISRLESIDRKAYDYYFHQARSDVLENKIPDLIYEKYKRELVGLGVTDMYRVMLEKDIPQGIVENDYKKYIPKEVLKRHSIFIKKPIHDTLGKIKKAGHDAWYVKMEYLKQLEVMAPEYLSEEYKALTDQDGSVCNIYVKVSPYHPTEPGIKICYESKREEWHQICTIDELCYISVRKDGTVEISRKNGIPFYLKFNSVPSMVSFVSLLDGYYRLTCKWIFNLCKDVPTPSLQKLYSIKCHGPVGGEFSYAKLEEKRGNHPGCFILRESETKYNIYYLDICMKDNSKPKTFKLERLTGDEFIFNDDLRRYKSIHQLMAAYNDPQGYIYLQECLPPSEYDKSPLLLCQSDCLSGDSLTDSSAVHGIIPATPLCINSRDIQVYKASTTRANNNSFGSLTDLSMCKVSHLGVEYRGYIAKTESGVRCQSWQTDAPVHKVDETLTDEKFPDNSRKRAKNYCRNPNRDPKGPWCYTMDPDLIDETCALPICNYTECRITGPGIEYGGQHNYGTSGTYCFAITTDADVKVEKRYCHIRKCKSAECKMAGTANDYIGKLNTTRSNRTCVNWEQYILFGNNTNSSTKDLSYVKYLNSTLYPDTTITDAENFCRNPSRNIAGSWCYTTDSAIQDICNVRDCNMPEECTILVKGQGEGQKKEGLEGITVVYRSMWRLTKGKKMEVAMKVLKHDCCEKYLKDFLELTGHWAFLQSNAIVRLYGITLSSPVSMVLEYMRLGPLDHFLRSNKAILKPVDLIEAASNLASALWHLEENGIVHGNIRCRKLMVSCHEENTFTVKLADPGIHHTYASKEVHWIPVECYSNLEFAKRSTAADVWSFATTVWEIFMFGEPIKHIDHLEAMRFYVSGKRLPQPPGCPNNVYQIMKECWDADPHRRKQPQALMRDINQILYQVYNSRRVHSYAKVFTKSHYGSQGMASASSTNSLFSITTESTVVVGYPDELISVSDMSEADSDLSVSSNFSKGSKLERTWLFNSQDVGNNEDTMSCDFSTVLSNFNFSVATSTTSVDSMSSLQSIFELDADCNVILQGRIGQGFYGEVYKGTLEFFGDKDYEPRQVAVKKLKASAVSTCLQDFEREISIMKTLKHPNIVEILGVLQEPEVSLVMEFVQHGSLQSYLKIYRESLSTKQLVKYALDIAKGMDYLGTKHIVHRDLAARNILVVNENHVKISDFGLAQVMGTNEYYILKTNRDLPIKWYAPESLRDGKFSPRSDVWSYGVTMCEMFGHGEEPKLQITDMQKSEGQEQQILLNAIESGARFPCPPMCPQAVYVRIIYPCWQADPHDRPGFNQLGEETEDLLLQY